MDPAALHNRVVDDRPQGQADSVVPTPAEHGTPQRNPSSVLP